MIITGRVQGVGFRYYVKTQADKYKISGYVKNNTDGSVFVYAEGEETELRNFKKKCEIGPSMSLVKNVDIQEVDPIGKNIFEIKI